MLSRVKYGGVVGLWGGGMHCALDLKWGGAETMAMKKTWQGFEKQPDSITSGGTVQNGACESGGTIERNIHT